MLGPWWHPVKLQRDLSLGDSWCVSQLGACVYLPGSSSLCLPSRCCLALGGLGREILDLTCLSPEVLVTLQRHAQHKALQILSH